VDSEDLTAIDFLYKIQSHPLFHAMEAGAIVMSPYLRAMLELFAREHTPGGVPEDRTVTEIGGLPVVTMEDYADEDWDIIDRREYNALHISGKIHVGYCGRP
jgi:hypothetical protein